MEVWIWAGFWQDSRKLLQQNADLVMNYSELATPYQAGTSIVPFLIHGACVRIYKIRMGGLHSLTRRKIVILVVVTLLVACGIAGYEAWQEHKRKQVLIDAISFESCDICSVVKKDLAEQVKHRKQQSEQTTEGPPDPP